MEALPDQSRRLTQASRPASPHHHVCHRHRPHFCRRRHRHRQRHRLLYQRNRRLLLLLLLLLLLPASRPASRLSSCSHIFDNTIFCSSHRRAVRATRGHDRKSFRGKGTTDRTQCTSRGSRGAFVAPSHRCARPPSNESRLGTCFHAHTRTAGSQGRTCRPPAQQSPPGSCTHRQDLHASRRNDTLISPRTCTAAACEASRTLLASSGGPRKRRNHALESPMPISFFK